MTTKRPNHDREDTKTQKWLEREGMSAAHPPKECELCGAPLNDLDTRVKLWPKGDYNHGPECPCLKPLL